MTQARNALYAALDFYIDCGVDVTLSDTPGGLLSMRETISVPPPAKTPARPPALSRSSSPSPAAARDAADASALLGSVEARAEALRLAAAAKTLDELKDAINGFDGLSIKRTATQMVFADGNASARVMVVGEAPGADEDRTGKPFAGAPGILLDRMFAAINMARGADDAAQAIYLSNILNWRPPGNRTPTPAEIDVARPFIERHMALTRPRYLVAAGGVAIKSLLNAPESITKIHGKWQDYKPQYPELWGGDAPVIPCLPLYHPYYLTQTPAKKRDAWAALLALQERLSTDDATP